MNSASNNKNTPFLKYIIYVLLGILTIITAWQTQTLSSLPAEYVRMERYKTDMGRIERGLNNIDTKLDRLIMRNRREDRRPQ